MTDEMYPAQLQEGAPEGAGAGAVDADPQANAESAAEAVEGAGAGDGAPQDDQGSESEEIELVVADEAPDEEKPPKDNAGWVKARQRERDLKAKAAELERRLAAYEQPAGAPEPGPRPLLSDPDVNYDDDAFEKKYDAWKEATKRKAEFDAKRAQEAEAAQRSWRETQESFAKREAELAKRLPGYVDARSFVEKTFNVAQQTALVKYAKDAPLVIAALGTDPKRAESLSSEGDLIAFAIKVRELEATLSTRSKTKVPPPEKRISGSGSNSAGADSHLEKLRAEADRTGDRTKVVEYLRKKREAKR